MFSANQEFLTSSYSEAEKGMWPHEYTVGTGTILYRFIDTHRRTPIAGADGPWWFEYEHFQTIKHFALRHGYSLGYAARLFAAILYEWSEVNAYVRAQVMSPLVMWKGKGKQIIVGKDRALFHPELDPRDVNRLSNGLASPKGSPKISKMTPMQGINEVYQLYIPGLGGPHHQFSKYFKYIESQPIKTG